VTDSEIDSRVAVLEETIAWLRGLKGVPDAPPIAPVDPMELSDLIPAGAAAALARRAKSTVAAWCRSNPINGDSGFAVKIGARWFVSKSRLLRHLGISQAI
jgi:hypothetical protein